MARSKKIFLLIAFLFLVTVGYITYDMGSRTTFPGAKPQLKERIKKQLEPEDSTLQDTVKAIYRQ